jgi:hypothetical protein
MVSATAAAVAGAEAVATRAQTHARRIINAIMTMPASALLKR